MLSEPSQPTCMRKLFLFPLTILCILFACKREGSVEIPRVYPNDPKAVSSALKVWHGVRTNGTAPAPTSRAGSPVLDPQSNNQVIKAIAGRYAIIEPMVTSGDVAGYYVQVNGATEYFKVDYAKPRNISGRMSNPVRKSSHNNALYRGMGIDSLGGGNLDSSIVIVIPSTLQPGQFCITYQAYDNAGNVSNVITACIQVRAFGTDAASSYLNGTWHITGVTDDTTAGWEPVLGVNDSVFNTGVCINNHIVDTFGFVGNINYPAYIYQVSKADLELGSNGGLKYTYAEIEKDFNYQTSSCSNFVFNSQTYTDVMNGAWSYTAATGSMVVIFDFDDQGVSDPEAYEYKLTKISNNKMYWYDPIDDSWLRLEK